MAFIVEDGTGKPDANSLVSVAEWDEYHTLRGNTAMVALSEADKQKYLVLGTDAVAAFRSLWLGSRVSISQATDWPRNGVYIANGDELWLLASNQVPVEVKAGVIELGVLSHAGKLVPTDKRGKSKVKVGPLEVTYDDVDAGARFKVIAPAVAKFSLYLKAASAGFQTARIVRT